MNQDRIEGNWKQFKGKAKVQCDTLKANARDVGEQEAKGAEKMRKM